jgi:hypothetical protein
MIAWSKADTLRHPGAVYDGRGQCFVQPLNVPGPRVITREQRQAIKARRQAARAARKRGRK